MLIFFIFLHNKFTTSDTILKWISNTTFYFKITKPSSYMLWHHSQRPFLISLNQSLFFMTHNRNKQLTCHSTSNITCSWSSHSALLIQSTISHSVWRILYIITEITTQFFLLRIFGLVHPMSLYHKSIKT